MERKTRRGYPCEVCIDGVLKRAGLESEGGRGERGRYGLA